MEPLNRTNKFEPMPIFMKTYRLIFVFCASALFSASLCAQEKYILDLDKSIEIAKEKSFEMLMLQENLSVAEYELKAATNKFKTNIDLALTMPNYIESIESWDTGGGLSYYSNKKLQYSSSLNITQPLPTDGYLFVNSGVMNIDDFNADTNSLRLNTRFGFRQPLDAFYSYNNIQAEFKKADLNYELWQKRLLRAELDLVYKVSVAFYNMLSAKEQLSIASMNRDRQKASFEVASNKYNAGLIRETEALQMEIDLGAAENNYDLASVRFTSSKNDLKKVLGLSSKDSISVVGDFEYSEVFVDVEKAVQLGFDNRLEIREREIEIELSGIQIKKRKADRFVKGDITAYYDFIGVGYDNLGTPAFGNAYDDMQNRPGNRGLALNIYIPLLDWGVNKSLQRAAEATQQGQRYNLELDKVTIETDIRNLVNRLHSSLNRLKLLERNVQLAERNFEISMARFNNGGIDAQTLALDRVRLNDSYLSRLDAYISYRLFLSDLARKTFYDFENNVALVR